MSSISNLLSPSALAKARALYPHIARGRIYLNHAATGPLSKRVVEAIQKHLDNRSAGIIDTYRDESDMIYGCRSDVTRLINAESPDRIAFLTNTSEAINVVASGLQWKSGDQILLNDIEFPANVYPYYRLKKHGIEIQFIQSKRGKVTPEMVEQALTSRTRLVAISAVQFLSGYRAEMETIGKMCRQKNIWFIVDGIQAVGAVKIDVQRMCIDALATGSQKWLMGPHGTGFLYLTEAVQNAIEQQHLGWLSVKDPWQFYKYDQPLEPSAQRYEGGSLNVAGIIGMKAALETLLEFDIDAIESHILALTRQLMEGLQTIHTITIISPEKDAERAGIVTIQSDSNFNFAPVLKELDKQNINISLRENKLRISPHYYNSPEEIEKSIEAIRETLHHMDRK